MRSLTSKAAKNIVGILRRIKWTPYPVVMFLRDQDELWSRLVIELDVASEPKRQTLVEYVPEMSNVADVLNAIGRIRSKSNTVFIVQDPVLALPCVPVSNAIRDIARSGAKLVFIEFPSRSTPFFDRVRDAYLDALSEPSENVTRSYATIRKSLKKGDSLLISENSVARVNLSAVYDDFSVLNVGKPIIQLPLGEVWGIIEHIEGDVTVAKNAKETNVLKVCDSRIENASDALGSIVELGVGANKRSLCLPTALGEKAYGRLHLGMGDSDLIGGNLSWGRHDDVLLSAQSSIESFTND